jgi:predicted nucleotide-binding protein
LGRSPEAPVIETHRKRKIFVVYGHDNASRNQLEATLRRWGLEPLILDQLPTGGQTVIEKLESAIAEASFGVVLATPDDQGHRTSHPDEKAYRARQNVVLELGMLLAKLGRPNVAILLKAQENMERPSDIQGLIYIPFADDIDKEAGVQLARSIASAGYNIDVRNL